MSEIHFFSLIEDEPGIIFYKTFYDMMVALCGDECSVIIGHCDEDYWVSDEAIGENIDYSYRGVPQQHEHRKGKVITAPEYIEYLEKLKKENEKLNSTTMDDTNDIMILQNYRKEMAKIEDATKGEVEDILQVVPYIMKLKADADTAHLLFQKLLVKDEEEEKEYDDC
tara:strand:- start:5493 stop:5996 length:504 start_codon:yes stop_codon:yes gene_type:complete